MIHAIQTLAALTAAAILLTITTIDITATYTIGC